jgi:hypothetical protein
MLRAVLAVPKRNSSFFTPNVTLTFCKLCEGNVVDGGVFTVLVQMFEACITFLLGGDFVSSATRNDWSP